MGRVSNSASLKGGILTQLQDTWEYDPPEYKAEQDILIRNVENEDGKPITRRIAEFAFKETVPFPVYWPMGTRRQTRAYRDRVLTVYNQKYELSIEWSKEDEEDDQLGDFVPHAQTAILHYKQLRSQFAIEYLEGTAASQPFLLNAFDGSPLFANVDGDGNARFQVTGGNTIVGTGIATTDQFLNDYFKAQRQFLKFKNPASRPIYTSADVAFKNLAIIVPPNLNKVAREALVGYYVATTPTLNHPNSNIVAEEVKKQVNELLFVNNLLSDSNSWYMVVKHKLWKPVLHWDRLTPVEYIANMDNSDLAREFYKGAIYTHCRRGAVPYAPWSAMKITNS